MAPPRPVAPALRANLLLLAGQYGKARELSPSYVSKLAFKDQDVIAKLVKDEGSFSVKTYDKWISWFAANWPKGVPWPALNRVRVIPSQPSKRKP